MKNLPKILKIFFLTVFLFEFIGFGLVSFSVNRVLAADITLTPQVGIPNSPFAPGETYTFNTKSTEPIADYIKSIYKYAIGVVGILATVVMMVGGIMWMMSGGSPERAGEAKAYIGAALTGLVLTLCSYLILATVNSALINFNISEIASVKELGCCEQPKSTSGATGCSQVSQDQCESGWQSSGYICDINNKCVNNAAANLAKNAKAGCSTISLSTGNDATSGQNSCGAQYCGTTANINYSKSGTYQTSDGWFYCCVCSANIYSTVPTGNPCTVYGTGWVSTWASECTNGGVLVQTGYDCCKYKP